MRNRQAPRSSLIELSKSGRVQLLRLGGGIIKHFVRSVLWVIAIASVIVLASCGGGGIRGSGGNAPTPPLISTNPPPPAGTANIAYPGFTFAVASGGTAPFAWSEAGALPVGLTFSSSGQLTGTPANAGSFPSPSWCRTGSTTMRLRKISPFRSWAYFLECVTLRCCKGVDPRHGTSCDNQANANRG
jgi:Putative Ig domain